MTDSLAKIEAFLASDYQLRVNEYPDYVNNKSSIQTVEGQIKYARLILEYWSINHIENFAEAFDRARQFVDQGFEQEIFRIQQVRLKKAITNSGQTDADSGLEYAGSTPKEAHAVFAIWKKMTGDSTKYYATELASKVKNDDLVVVTNGGIWHLCFCKLRIEYGNASAHFDLERYNTPIIQGLVDRWDETVWPYLLYVTKGVLELQLTVFDFQDGVAEQFLDYFYKTRELE